MSEAASTSSGPDGGGGGREVGKRRRIEDEVFLKKITYLKRNQSEEEERERERERKSAGEVVVGGIRSEMYPCNVYTSE